MVIILESLNLQAIHYTASYIQQYNMQRDPVRVLCLMLNGYTLLASAGKAADLWDSPVSSRGGQVWYHSG